MVDVTSGPSVTAEEIRAACGDILDWKAAAILALRPSPADLTLAAAAVGGEAAEVRLEGLAAQVFDILVSDEAPDVDEP